MIDLAAERPRHLQPPGVRVLAGIGVWLAQQRDRWSLWLPVGLGIGIAGYFALPVEPPGWAGILAVLVLLAVAWRIRGQPPGMMDWIRPLVLALLALAVGFTAAQCRTALVAAPSLHRQIGPTMVSGRILTVERLDDGVRVVLDRLRLERLGPEETPRRVRIRLRDEDAVVLRPGADLSVLAILDAPPEAVEPGAYDFRRHAWFQGIGATGFAVKPALVTGQPGAGDGWDSAAERLRDRIALRVAVWLDGAVAAIATALLNGNQGAIAEADLEAMRISGLQHLLSISGLHVGLVAGLVFFSVRAGLALWPWLALRRPIKKWAAVAALTVTVAYTLLVGAPVPTQRAALMTGIVLLAVLVDRSAISLRGIALAAAAILLIQPESLIGPSFQMSFSAVLWLIAAYEMLTPWLAGSAWRGHWWGRAALYVGGLLLTSVIATLATTPFTLFHFQQVPVYGMIANLLAVPITSFIIMPLGLIALLAMPFGLEGWPLIGMGWGVQAMLAVAHWVADWPGAVLRVPAMPMAGLALMTLGGLWMALWRGAWRWLGAVPLLLGLVTPVLVQRPDILINGSGTLIAVRMADGDLMLSSGRAGRFESMGWRRRDGGQGRPTPWPKGGTGPIRCDASGCLYQPPQKPDLRIALVWQAEAVAEDCATADVVISRVRIQDCAAPWVIDPYRLARQGAHALYVQSDGVRVVASRRGGFARPWD